MNRCSLVVSLHIACCGLVATAGCAGTEIGNPAAPTIDAARIELVEHPGSYEVIGQAGAVTESVEVVGFEVWSDQEPLRTTSDARASFSFEFVGSEPPFRVFAENDGGRSVMVELGEERIPEIVSCFSYEGSDYDYDVGAIEATGEMTEVISLPFRNKCATGEPLVSVSLRLSGDGLLLDVPSEPVAPDEVANLRVLAGPEVVSFDNLVLVGDRSAPSIAIRGQVRR